MIDNTPSSRHPLRSYLDHLGTLHALLLAERRVGQHVLAVAALQPSIRVGADGHALAIEAFADLVALQDEQDAVVDDVRPFETVRWCSASRAFGSRTPTRRGRRGGKGTMQILRVLGRLGELRVERLQELGRVRFRRLDRRDPVQS